MCVSYYRKKKQALEEITSLFSLHVKGVKTIYEETEFKYESQGLRYVGFSFTVRRVKVGEVILLLAFHLTDFLHTANFGSWFLIMDHNDNGFAFQRKHS